MFWGDLEPIQLLFAGAEGRRWLVHAAGYHARVAFEHGDHIEDVFHDLEKNELPKGGLLVFEGESQWVGGDYDADWNLHGKWRRATAAEILRFMGEKEVFPGHRFWSDGTETFDNEETQRPQTVV